MIGEVSAQGLPGANAKKLGDDLYFECQLVSTPGLCQIDPLEMSKY